MLKSNNNMDFHNPQYLDDSRAMPHWWKTSFKRSSKQVLQARMDHQDKAKLLSGSWLTAALKGTTSGILHLHVTTLIANAELACFYFLS